MVPYSNDLRTRVLAAVDAGEKSQKEIAELFHVSARWIRKLVARRAETGEVGPKPNNRGGRKLAIQGEMADSLRAAVAKKPDATLNELRETTGFSGCLSTVWRTLNRWKITRKKSRYMRLSNSTPKSSPKGRNGANGWSRSTRIGSSSSTKATRRPR